MLKFKVSSILVHFIGVSHHIGKQQQQQKHFNSMLSVTFDYSLFLSSIVSTLNDDGNVIELC